MSVFWRSCAAAVMAVLVWIGSPSETAAAEKPAAARGSAAAAPETFLRTAEALYQAALEGDAVRVRNYAREMDARLRALPMRRIASAEGVEALARSVTRLKRSVAAVSPNPDAWRSISAEIRLAADELVHPDKPMWHRYRTILADDLRLLEEAIGGTGGIPLARAQLERLQAHYDLIRTAVLMHAEPYLVERADSVLRYAGRVLGASQPNPELLRGLVPSLREPLESLFPAQQAADTAVIVPAPSPSWGWPALMGTFIVTILTWAGWQRYKRPESVTPRENLPPTRRERR